MNLTNGGFGSPVSGLFGVSGASLPGSRVAGVRAFGAPVFGTGVSETRVWPHQVAKAVTAGPLGTDIPMTKPPYVSASERCP